MRAFPSRLTTALLCGVIWAGSLQAAPYHPSNDDQVLERLPAGSWQDETALRELHQALRDDPKNIELALATARAYVAQGRAEADPRLYGYAQAALAPWWEMADPPREVLVLRAILRQAGHDFEAALADLDQVLDRDPDHAQARLSQALILRAQGRPAAAAESCKALGSRVPPLAVATCLSAAESLSGQAPRSYERLLRALEATDPSAVELRLWALTVLGEIAVQVGDLAAAEGHFGEALALGQRNTYLLGALADLLLDQGRFADVRQLLAGEERSDGLLLRLTEAEQRLGDTRARAHRADLAARFTASRRRGDSRHIREEARYHLRLLAQDDDALRLAQENWRHQREPADARLLLEAALAAGQPEAARPVLEWLQETRLQSAPIDTLVALLEWDSGT